VGGEKRKGQRKELFFDRKRILISAVEIRPGVKRRQEMVHEIELFV
jgi:hypothetical protein